MDTEVILIRLGLILLAVIAFFGVGWAIAILAGLTIFAETIAILTED